MIAGAANISGETFADAATGLIGTAFRFGGRDPATGVDCVGLVVAALERCGHRIGPLPLYRLRQIDLDPLLRFARSVGLCPANDATRAGDVVLLQPSLAHCHLAIIAPEGLVHAHAGLGRVVSSPATLPWPVLHRWRLG